MKVKTDNKQAFIDELHRDVYIALTQQKMSIEKIAEIMHLTPETIMQMIQTYQERIEHGTVA